MTNEKENNNVPENAEGGKKDMKDKKSIKEQVLGMVNNLNKEKAEVYGLKAAILKEENVENIKTLKDELKIHKKNVRILRAKLLAIPVATLVSLGLLVTVMSAIKGSKKKVIDTSYEEIEDIEEDDDVEDESVDETDDSVEE